MWLALQNFFASFGCAGRWFFRLTGLSFPIGSLGACSRALLRFALSRRFQRNTGASRLAQADRNGLLRRPRAMFALANMLNFLVNKLARRSRG
jgi:hypothetical protein